MGNLVAEGADTVICKDWQQPADPGERGPDILLDAEDMRQLAGYLRVRWKDGEELRTKTKCPGIGHWTGRLIAVNPITEPR